MAEIDKFANQVDTKTITDHRLEVVPGLLWGTRRKRVAYKRQANDDEETQRYFQYRAPLLRILFSHGQYVRFTPILDGVSAGNFSAEAVIFRIAPEELSETGGKPVADIWFRAYGKRQSCKIHDYYKAVFTFASREQMEAYLDVSGRRLPKGFRFGGTEYSQTSGGQYQSSDGSVLPWLIVAYLMLSGNEQKAMAAQNPELQQMLEETKSAAAEAEVASPGEGTPVEPGQGVVDTDAPLADGPAGGGSDSGDSGSSSGDSGGGGSGSGE